MKKPNKSRELILEGITMHLKCISLTEIKKLYDERFKAYELSRRDKKLVKFLTYAIIRNRGVIENILSSLLIRKLPSKRLEIKAGLMIGISQILFTRIENYAAVSSSVDLFEKKLLKWRSLANALLRKVSKNSKKNSEYLANSEIYVPNWINLSWKKQFGNTTYLAIVKTLKTIPDIDLRIKDETEIKVISEKLNAKILSSKSIRIKKSGLIKHLDGYEAGKWWVQDIAAQLPVMALGKIEGKSVIELCAAPGGKTAQLLDMGASVLAVDISKRKVKKLINNIARINLSKNLKVLSEDARKWMPEKKSDMVLLDVPCSATGTIRKNPDVIWNRQEKDISNLVKRQKQLLENAIKMTNKNGIIVYSNCSIQFEEGEKIIADFLKNKKVVLDDLKSEEILDYPKEIFKKGYIRTLPIYYKNFGEMDGFFIARLRKISDN